MDFSWDEDRAAVAELARDNLAAQTARGAAGGATDSDGFDRTLWASLAESGLVGMALPEAFGGAGTGLSEVGILAQALGGAAVTTPIIESIVLAALPIARFGSPHLRERWLPAISDGSALVIGTAAGERSGFTSAVAPLRVASDPAGDLVLTGTLSMVAWAGVADALLVEALDESGAPRHLVVETAKLTLEPQRGIDDTPYWRVGFDGVHAARADALEPAEDDVADWIHRRFTVCTCMHLLGLVEGALALTAQYVSEREQFGVKIGTFQAVSQRLAEAYIGADRIRLTAWEALWLLDEGAPDARVETIAAWHASDAAPSILRTAQHVHGGISIDLDYPIHRYYLAGRRDTTALGGASRLLGILGEGVVRAS